MTETRSRASDLVRIVLAVLAGLVALQVAFALFGALRGLLRPFVEPFAGNFGGYNPDFPTRGVLGLALVVVGSAYLLRRRPLGGGATTTVSLPRSERLEGHWWLVGAKVTGWIAALWSAGATALVAALWALGAIRLRWPFLPAAAAVAALGYLGYTLVRTRRPARLAVAAAGLLVPAVLVGGLASWDGTAGYRSVSVSEPSELARRYRHAAGILRLDLAELRLPAGVTDLGVEVSAGEVEITVPPDATVEASARLGAGEYNLLGSSQAGMSLEGHVRQEGEPGAGTLRITSWTAVGQVKVFRADPADASAARRGGGT
ncbi:MAG: LiaF domain-containing protein [Acidimicrobiia bacterium]